jgi:predicted PurR-regulated permease PerM
MQRGAKLLGHRDDTARDVPAGALDVRSLALTGLFVLAVFFALSFARAFLLPVTIAVLLSFLLGPAVRGLRVLRVPDGIGAAIVLLVLLGSVGFGAYNLAAPASAWLATAPERLQHVEAKIRTLRRPVEQVNEAAERVESLTDVGGEPVPMVALKSDGLTTALLGQTQGFLGGTVITVVLLYFLLASGDLFLRKFVRVLAHRADERRALAIINRLETNVSRYLGAVTLINLGVGIATGTAMFAIGMPNPALWGLMVALFNFVPYLGPLTSEIILGLVGLATFDALRWALLPPLLYFGIDMIASMVVTPLVLGRRLALNPAVIFLAVTLWGWLWGIPGALLAVPMLATFKIFCDEIESLTVVGEFLGR